MRWPTSIWTTASTSSTISWTNRSAAWNKLHETSYLLDYEKERDVAWEYYRAHEHQAFAASTISMFELAFGVVWDGEADLDTLQESLQWVDFLDFSAPDAIDAATIQAERHAAGERVPIGNLLIAGVARNRGATLVAGDGHFERIEGLTVENHREA